VLGAGGFGITYMADDVALNRSCAIKEYFPSDFAARDSTLMVRSKSTACAEDYEWGLERFIEEAQTLAKFEHPNITRVHRYFRANNTGYMVLKFEEGTSFKTWLDKLGRPPSQAELDGILRPLLDALDLIHAQDFLHRDIAPDNIIIRPDGSPVLIDFGSARGEVAQHSRTVSALVKPGYSPFEQYAATGKQQGPWTDIYALGATLYHAVTGSRPYDSPTRMTTDDLKPAAEAARAKYRPAFLKAVDQAMRLRIEDRPRSVDVWRKALLGESPAPVARIVPAKADVGLPLARTRKLDPAVPAIARWPGKKQAQKAEAAPAAPAVARPAPVAAEPAPRQQPQQPVNRRSLLKLLDGVRAAVASSAAPKGNEPAAAIAVTPPANDDATTELARNVPAAAAPPPPPARPAQPAPRRVPKAARAPVLPRIRSAGKSWLRRLPWMQLILIGGLVAAMIHVNNRPAGERPATTRASTVNLSTDLGLVRAIRPQKGAIRSLAVAPDGRALAIAGTEGTLAIIDAESGLGLRTLATAGSSVTAIDFADGAVAVARRDGEIEIYDLLKGERAKSFREPEGPVWSVRFAGGPRQIVAAGADKKVRILDRDRGTRATISGFGNDVLAVVYSPPLKLIAAAGSDKLVRIYEQGRMREAAHTLAGHTDDVSALAFSPDGTVIASASFDGTAILWSAGSGALLQRLSGHQNRLTSIAFSGDGALVATGSEDQTVKLWDARTGELLHSYEGHAGAVRAVAFLPKDSQLVSAGDDQTLRIWSAKVAGYR
jgi:WD40 repeat protein/serine/threonine protein kinase